MVKTATGAARGWAALAVLLAASSLLSLLVGPARLSAPELVSGLLSGDGVPGLILREIRLPRLLLSLGVGAVLGLCGASLQGLLRNPLAEPSIFGASQSAALGAVTVLYFGLADAFSFALPLAAIACAFLSTLFIMAAVGRRADLTASILSGLALSSLAGAATALVINLSPNPFAVTEIVFWLMGSFEDRSMRHVLLAAPCLLLSAVLLLRCGHGYRLLTLGEEVAATLGVDMTRLRLMTIAGVAAGVGGGVAVSGSIGFVGLVAPYLVRPFWGADPQRLLLPSAAAGAVLLTLSDALVRLIPSNTELKVGVLTALLGVPVFLYLVIARRSGFAGGAS